MKSFLIQPLQRDKGLTEEFYWHKWLRLNFIASYNKFFLYILELKF